MNFAPLLSGLVGGASMAASPAMNQGIGAQGAANGIGGMNGPMGAGTSGAGGGGLGALMAAMMAQRGAQNGGTSPMGQQQFSMPTQPGTQFSMPTQASAQYGQNGPGYQNQLAQALMAYGGGNGGQ
jgi:hypothetical protein